MPRMLPNEMSKSTIYVSADTKALDPSSFVRDLLADVGDEKALPPADREGAVEKDMPPDGGLVAWLQVFAAFLLVLNSRGLTVAFGVFQEYYTNTRLKGINPSAISWIGSLQSFLLMFGGVFCGRLLDAGHLRIQLCAGITLQFIGMLLTSFATRYREILLAQGLCVGAGSSFLWLPSAVVVTQYFDTRIMLATGIAASGSPAAGVIYPILVRKLIDHVDYPWAMRIMAFIVLTMNTVCLVLMRLRVPPRKGGQFFDLSMFRDPPYCAFVASMSFLYMSAYVPFFYIQDYAHDIGVSAALQTYILSILNAASLLSRVGPSWLADKIGGLDVAIPFSLISCVTILALPWVTKVPGLITIVVIYGLFSGVLVSLPPATIASISENPNEYGTRIGMAFAVCAFGVLIGNPIGGALLASAKSAGDQRPYMRLWFFASGTMFISGAMVALARYLVSRRNKADKGDSSSNTGQHETEEEFEKEKEENHVVPTRHGRKWHQILVEDAIAMQGLSAW
ncbi:MAG: hypothetical protein M1813_004691 [Trichoglossum hirsutum]|nr:MAG: hypothetical protein M1813_004691 [Trichoglossum hirsutum]